MATTVEEVSKPCVELALNAIGREFGEQGKMTDCIKSKRYVQRNSADPMTDVKGLHPLLDEYKQHVQGGVTRSKTKLVI